MEEMENRKLLVGIAIVTMVALVAWALFVQPHQEAKQKQPLRVIFQTWVGDAPVYIAQEKGFFAKRGLDVEVTRVETAAERRALLSTGKADISHETIDMAVVDTGSGVPLDFFLTLDQSNGADGVVASQEIKTLSDLQGKKVGAAKGEVPYMLLRYLMKKQGIPKDSVDFLDLYPDNAGAAFLAGKIDAAGTWEPWLSNAANRTGGHILVSSADAPGIIVDVAAAPKAVAASRKADLIAYSCAWFEALDYIQSNPDESYSIMAKYFDVSPAEFRGMVEKLKWNTVSEHSQYFASGSALQTTKSISEIAYEDALTPTLIDAQSLADAQLASQIGEECGK